MRTSLKFTVILLLFGALLLPGSIRPQCAEPPQIVGFSVILSDGAGGALTIHPQLERDGLYLFLPAGVPLNGVPIHYEVPSVTLSFQDGTPILPDVPTDLTPYLSRDNGDGRRMVNLVVSGQTVPLWVMQSANIPSLFIRSADPSRGQIYVDAVKGNKGSGTVTMLSSTASPMFNSPLTEIKARGNTTYAAAKKPYQIKLGVKADLTMTSQNNASKTWILLANAYDPTLIHNTSACRMAAAFGLDAPDCRPVDLYYDGIYRGNYLISEKVQIGEGRVSIYDLESANQKANAGKKIDSLKTATGRNQYGGTYTYVPKMTDPGMINAGYLLELDEVYYASERCYFITTAGIPFVVKSPESCSQAEMLYISEYVEELMQAALNGGICPTTQKSVWDYVDKTSLARYFLLQETVANADSFASSCYFYLPGAGLPLKAGPVWDFDDSCGIREDRTSTSGWVSGRFIQPFMNLPDFRREVRSFVSTGTYRNAAAGRTSDYVSEIRASARMDRVLWDGRNTLYLTLPTYEENISYMKNYQSRRVSWIRSATAGW